MKVDLSVAGLTDEARHILQVAANLLAAYRLSARLREWDGTRCDALFVDAQDGYGRRAAQSAQRRGIQVVHFAGGPAVDDEAISHIPSTGPIAGIVRHLHQLFVAPAGVRGEQSPASNIVRMALSPAWDGSDLAFRGNGRSVLVLRSSSRVLAASLSDILFCRDHIDSPAWGIEVLEPGAARLATHHVAISLDSFLCQAVEAVAGPFPPHAAGRWVLQDWPDLGAATGQVAALQLARVLHRGPASASELTAASGLGADVVARYLWAFRAAGLLRAVDSESAELAPADTSAATTSAPPGGSVLARLARRFGLSWK